MNWDVIQIIASSLFFALGAAAGIYAWLYERGRIRRKGVDNDMGALQTRAGDLERRIAVVERDQATAPTHQDLGKIYAEVNSLARSIATLEGTIGRMAESLSRVEQHLINRANRRHGDDQ